MLRPAFAKGNQSVAEMLRLSTDTEHPRTRERCLALYILGRGQSNTSRWSCEIGRQDITVQRWVYRYNEAGMAGIIFIPDAAQRALRELVR